MADEDDQMNYEDAADVVEDVEELEEEEEIGGEREIAKESRALQFLIPITPNVFWIIVKKSLKSCPYLPFPPIAVLIRSIRACPI